MCVCVCVCARACVRVHRRAYAHACNAACAVGITKPGPTAADNSTPRTRNGCPRRRYTGPASGCLNLPAL